MLFDHATSILSNANTINNNIAAVAVAVAGVVVLPEIPAATLTDDDDSHAAKGHFDAGIRGKLSCPKYLVRWF